MATTPARFEFHCSLSKLNFVHSVPATLVTPNSNPSDTQFIKSFTATIAPILQSHESACRTASSPQCQTCGSKTTKVLQTPMSWLHIVSDPFVLVWVNPICDKALCEGKARLQIQDMMRLMSGQESEIAGEPATAEGSYDGSIGQVLMCRVCGKTDGAMKCARCKSAAYCGKEHQKSDWKSHKSVCAALSKAS